jgi:ornithine cyclodeaminase/alanine dehydrogenase-like protein (mu-crystallin family)
MDATGPHRVTPAYLTEADVARLLTPAAALAAVEACCERVARGVVSEAPRVRLEVPGGVFAVMAAADPELGYAGHKSYAWLAPAGTPFVVVLFSLAEARVAAIVEADTLGQLRTAAASALAARLLARSEPATLGVLGCGRQAAAHVTALREVLPSLERTIAYCRDRDRLAAFCAAYDCDPAGSHRDAGECDVVVTATTARDPVLRGEWLRPGALVLAIGGNEPDARELDDAVLARASFVCTDSRDQARGEAGDLIEPVAHGVLDWLEVHELPDVVTGVVHGRTSPEDIVVFKSNGIAAWDVATAAAAVALS